MRFCTPALAAAALLLAQIGPAVAQTTAPPAATAPATLPPAATPPAAPPPAAATPDTSVPEATAPVRKPRKPRAYVKRMSLHQRFKTANTSGDGHLTLDQAKAAHWPYAVRNFTAIDKDRKGYITEADIHAFGHARYLARHAHRTAPLAPAAPPQPPAPPPAPAQ